MIHGTEDEVIDFSHGLAIYEKCPRAVDPLWVEVRKYDLKSISHITLNHISLILTKIYLNTYVIGCRS